VLRSRPRRALVALLLALAVAPVSASADAARATGYDAGQRAFDAGRIAEARAIWRPLARAGAVRAQHALGVLYERGGGRVDAAPSRAATWYRRAAAQGHRDARTNLGRLYATGRGVPEDAERAAELWRRAARQGHAVAQYNLALAYHQGRGVDGDARRAARWLRRAAAQGVPAAQHALARMYRLGRTLPRDSGRALAWYARAADNGHAPAKQRAQALRERGVRAAEVDPESRERPSKAPRVHGDRYAVWLGSAESRDAARKRWTAVRTRFPDIVTPLRLRLRTVGNGRRDPITRVLAGAFPRRAAASGLCADLRARDRGAFCQVRPLGR